MDEKPRKGGIGVAYDEQGQWNTNGTMYPLDNGSPIMDNGSAGFDGNAQPVYGYDPNAQVGNGYGLNMQAGFDPNMQANLGYDPNMQTGFGYDPNMQQGYGYDPNMQPAYGYDPNAQPVYGYDPNAVQPVYSMNAGAGGYGYQVGYDVNPYAQSMGQTGYTQTPTYSLQSSQAMMNIPPQEHTSPQAILYTGPVEGLASQTGHVPTPQMQRKGLGGEEAKARPWMKWAIGVGAFLILLVGVYAFWPRPKGYTAGDVLQELYQRGLPILNAYSYTAELDPEQLFGTTGGYTSKVAWDDANVEPGNGYPDNGGIIEVFSSAQDAQDRAFYLGSIAQSEAGRVTVTNRVVMRLSTRLSPSGISMYQTALRSMFGSE